MVNFVYIVKDSSNPENNKKFKNDYKKAYKYLQALHNETFRKYLTYSSDKHEEKFFYSNGKKRWKTSRIIRLDTEIQARQEC